MSNKRAISVRSEKPTRLTDDTIYVVTKEGAKDITVLSRDPFGYRNLSLEPAPRMEVLEVSNYVGDFGGYYHVPIETVLDLLVKENDVSWGTVSLPSPNP